MNDFSASRTFYTTCPDCGATHSVEIAAYAEVWDIDIELEQF